jgi:C-terminal processing protease CtpA/Prc
VKMKNILLLAVVLSCVACNVSKKALFDPAHKYSKEQLQQDFSLLENILHNNHPSLYWYATPDSVNGYFAATKECLQDSLTEQQFRNKISWAINKIHCGHTTVRSSKKYSTYFIKRTLPFFPLSLKVWEDSAVVVANLLGHDPVIKRGTIITGINNFTTKQILDSICQFIATDGYSNTFQYQLISFNFPAYYRNVFGTDSVYVVKYIDSVGQQKDMTLRNFQIKADTVIKKQGPAPEGLQKKQFRNLKLLNNRNITIDTALSTAFLSVNTFSEGKLNSFFKRSFKSIKDQNVQNLVLDLRLNSGGSVLSSTKLIQYLAKKPFHVADTVAAFTRQFPYKSQIKPWFIYWLSMHITGRRYSDDRIHFRFFETHSFRPKNKNHFDGNIYLLTGGYTFSAATLVTGKLKGQNNVTVVGEETGGGAYGNSAMFLTTIVLPNTGIRVTLPLYRMVLDATLPKNGRGVFPDVEVKPSVTTIKAGVDAKLEKVKELIRENKNTKISLK